MRRNTVNGDAPMESPAHSTCAVELLQRRPYRHHHERHEYMRQRDDHAGHRKNEANWLGGDVQRLQRIIQDAVIAEQDLPAERSHDDRDQQRTRVRRAGTWTATAVSCAREQWFPEHRCTTHKQGHGHGHSCRAQEDCTIVRITDHLKIVAPGVGREGAGGIAENVERQNECQRQWCTSSKPAEQQERGRG